MTDVLPAGRSEIPVVHTAVRYAATVLALASLVGCNPDSRRSGDALPAIGVVTVVGDETATAVLSQLADNGIQTANSLEDQPASKLIVIVQDCMVGPLPVHQQIVKSLDKRPTEEYLWILTNSSKAMVDDQELLELEELECREMFNSQGLPGDDVTFGFDSSTALVRSDYPCPKGWPEIIRHIRSVAR